MEGPCSKEDDELWVLTLTYSFVLRKYLSLPYPHPNFKTGMNLQIFFLENSNITNSIIKKLLHPKTEANTIEYDLIWFTSKHKKKKSNKLIQFKFLD